MSESKSQKQFEAAIKLDLLSKEQLEAIELEQAKSDRPPLEIAIRKGFIKGKQLETLDVFANPTQVAPGYRIDSILGQGGVGTVYKATQLRMERPVAIKTINRSATRNDLTPKRFEREAKIVGQLRHPNIISAFDFGIHNDELYLVMEFIDGIDADKLLREEKCIPEVHAWHIAKQVCNALENAKQHGVIHRDIKPGNLILATAPAGTEIPTDVPFVKVADFGLAKFNDKQLDPAITIEQSVSGTPFYMSPEQIQAETIDHRSDIYSLGATIWHLIVGEPPVSGTGPLDVITSKMKLEDDWLAEQPQNMSKAGFTLMKKMCRHDREQRIDDYAVLNQEIDLVIEGLRDLSPGETTRLDVRKTFTAKSIGETQNDRRELDANISQKGSKRGVLKWIVAAVGLAALLGAISYALSSAGKQEPDSHVRLTELTGPPIFLFDGRAVDPKQKSSGTWQPGKGVEDEPILSGTGTRNFRCQDNKRMPLENFQFICGFRHNKAEKIGFRLLDASEKLIWEVGIQPDQATLKSGQFSSLCPVQEYDQEKSVGYHYFRLESQPEHWRIEIDSELLGEVPKPKRAKEMTENRSGDFIIQLFVDGAEPAHFETIRFRRYAGTNPVNAQ